MKTGLTLPISAKKGIGSSRCCTKSNKDFPPVKLPVKPTPLTSGWLTKLIPSSWDWPPKCENASVGTLLFFIAK